MNRVKSPISKLTIFKILPILVIVVTVFILAFTNIIPHTYFSGWDNMHPEFDIWTYAKRMIFGAWVSFQGTGAPASQSQLAEITRLPFIFLLKFLLPDNLVRYSFHFLMVLIGGIGIYLYLGKIWLTKVREKYRNWIACFGALYYILNITTLQQFYISFECFAVEFAFLPFVFMSIHELCENVNKKTILKFIFVQLLIAPYAFVPTIVYFVFIFITIYSFFVNLQIHHNFFQVLKKTLFLIGLVLAINCYWMLPNIYYMIHNAHYVQESRANQLFDLEALWSVRQVGTFENFLTGAHFIFNWKHFNFQIFQYEYNYKAWSEHLSGQLTLILLALFNLFSHVAFIKLIFNRSKGYKRWGFIIIFSIITVLIWMGIFIPDNFFKFIYSFGIIQNSLRNVYTKLSTVYSFALTILLCLFIETIINKLLKYKNYIITKVIPIVILLMSFVSIIYIALPSFQGNFIDKQLKISYPREYFDMVSFLRTKPSSSRVLELPFLAQDGWILYNWTTLGKAVGYQGMGFYYFGIPQALITTDFARWTETTDFFYHELKHTINSQNPTQLNNLLEKYNVDLVVVDNTVFRQYIPDYDNQKNHQLLKEIGYKKVWNKNFLSVYEKTNPDKKGDLIIPTQVSLVDANSARVRRDYVYENIGGYINVQGSKQDIIYPFINITSPYVNDVNFQNDRVGIDSQIVSNNYTLKIPGIKEKYYNTLVKITYSNQSIEIIFPKNEVIINNAQSIILPNFENIFYKLEAPFDGIILYINNQQFQLNNNQTIYPVLNTIINQPLSISFIGSQNEQNYVSFTPKKSITVKQPDWKDITQDITIKSNINHLKIQTTFPAIFANLQKYPSNNCNQPKFGITTTKYSDQKGTYIADEYGVNCSYYNFDYFTPNTSYLLQMSGKNNNGRSIKLFINYNASNTIPEEHLLPKDAFTTTIGLMPISETAQSAFALNWETRSHGQLAENELYELKYIPFPLERFSQIRLQKENINNPIINDVSKSESKSFFNFLYFINVNCKNNPCFIGIDQAYDDLWIALDKNLRILPHLRYNNWANIWQVSGSQKITVVYIPQIVSSLCLILLISGIIYLVIMCKRGRS